MGDRIDFTTQAVPDRVFSGRISFIDPVLDKTTRTVRVRVDMPNPGGVLKPEMYLSATVKAGLSSCSDRVVIPRSAVLWTGKRSVVYVCLSGYDQPLFRLREVELGPSLGDDCVILSGLKEGERIVTDGVFAVDASAQLEGKRSMMARNVPADPDEGDMPMPMEAEASSGTSSYAMKGRTTMAPEPEPKAAPKKVQAT